MLNHFGIIFNFLSSLNLIFVVLIDKWNTFNYFTALLIPLSYKIAKTIQTTKLEVQLDKLLNKDKKELRNSLKKIAHNQQSETLDDLKIDYYLRNLFTEIKLDFDDYLSEKTSMILDELTSLHQIYCPNPQFCFCTQVNYLFSILTYQNNPHPQHLFFNINFQKFQNLHKRKRLLKKFGNDQCYLSLFIYQNKKKDLQDKELRSQYMYDYIEKYYENKLSNSTQRINILHLGYLMFLLDVKDNTNKCQVKALQLQKQLKGNQLIYQQAIQNILQQAQERELTQIQQDTFDQNQKTQKDLHFVEVIHFDFKIHNSYLQMRECLELKKVFIKSLGNDHIILEEIYSQLLNARNQRTIVYEELENLIKLQIKSPQLSSLISIYESSLSFDHDLSKLAKVLEKKAFNFRKQVVKENYFDSNYCSAFVSLTDKLGQVKKVSNNFDRVVPILTNKEAIGKNISFMQPPAVAQIHNKILLNYLNKPDNKQNISHFSLIIGVDKNGWALPYDIKLQPFLMDQQDFGVCALIKQIKDSNYYIIAKQSLNFEIITVSQQFYIQILEKSVSSKLINSINLTQLIPALPLFFLKYKLSGQQNIFKEFSTILVRPHNQEQLQRIQNLPINQDNLMQLFDYDLYIIKGEINSNQNQFVQIIQFKIVELKKLNQKSLKIEELNNLQNFYEKNKNIKKEFKNKPQPPQNSQLIDSLLTFCTKNQQIQGKNQQRKEEDEQFGSRRQTLFSNDQQRQANQDLNLIKSSLTTDLVYSPKNMSNNNLMQFQDQKYDFIQEDNTKQMTLLLSPVSSSRGLFSQRSQLNQIELENFQLDQTSLKQNFINSTYITNISKNNEIPQKQLDFAERNFIQRNSVYYVQNLQGNPIQPINQISKQDTNSEQSQSYSFLKFDTQQFQSKQNQDNQLEGSIRSSRSGGCSTQQRKFIKENVKSIDKYAGINIVRWLGSLGLFSFLVLNLSNFYSLDKQLSMEKEDYQNIDWGSKLRTIYGQVVTDQSYFTFLSLPLFKISPEAQIQMTASLIYQQKLRLQQYQQLILQFVQFDKSKTDLYNMILNKDAKFSFATSIINVQDTVLKFGYIQIALLGYMYKVTTGLDNGYDLLQLNLNYVETYDQIQKIKQGVNGELNKQFDQIIFQALAALFIILVTILLFSVSFIFIFSYMQKKREEILVLFSTFPPNKLINMLTVTMNSISLLDFNTSKYKQRNYLERKTYKSDKLSCTSGRISMMNLKEDLSNLIKKKKNISTFQQLPRFSLKILIISLIFFILTQVHTVSIYLLIKNFISNEKINREFVNGLSDMTDYVANLNSVRIPLILLTLGQQLDLLKLYKQRLQYNVDRRKELENGFYTLLSNQYNQNRYKQKDFDSYVYSILEGDACKTVSENSNLLKDDQFSLEKCNQIKNGIFKTGLIKVIKYQIDTFIQRWPVFQENDLNIFIKGILIQEQDLNEVDNYFIRIFYLQIVSTINEKIARLTEDHYNQMISLNKSLFILSIFNFLFAIYLSYVKFFESQMKILRQTKQLMDIIDIRQLEDNQYIQTYFRLVK